tara:strand:+ start:1172 stop:1393 length:222 start_codon:yes stop_codon:yes gene_type:complete
MSNRFYDLPDELQRKIYKYDITYRVMYDLVMYELRSVYMFFSRVYYGYRNPLSGVKVIVPTKIRGRHVKSGIC